MAEINPRDITRACIPSSIRAQYNTLTDALLDSPRTGDIAVIGDEVYYFTGSSYRPYGWQGDVQVPTSAFTDSANPTEAEVAVYITANYPQSASGSTFYLPGNGSATDPDYVWQIDASGNVTRIEEPAASPNPVAIIDVMTFGDTIDYNAGNSYSKETGCGISLFQWTIVDSTTGTVLDSFSGAENVDASGETYVVSGTYDQLQFIDFSTYPGIEITLNVTDCNGLISEDTTRTHTG